MEAEAIDLALAWHGRLMVLAWAILIPLGVIAARFFKIVPWQQFPQELDNQSWWHAHLFLQYAATLATIGGVYLIVNAPADALRSSVLHRVFGWITVALCGLQILGAWLRGSKGGPTDRRANGSVFGHHYHMTRKRRVFEAVHKSLGYLLIMLASATVLHGLAIALAPRWMAMIVVAWWSVLVVAFVLLQRRGYCVDTYVAIWGHAPEAAEGLEVDRE